MHEDEEGFLYPQVDFSICINCGLCEKVCPVLNQHDPKLPLEVLAAKNKNDDQRLLSSSGGIFILLAEQTINHGGVVFGARFDSKWEVEHCYAETYEELEPLMRSKYVQSRIGNTYKEAEQFLKQGRLVMFVGVPCQIAGLKHYLCKEYENLLTVDVVCHGVPSPKVWREYIKTVGVDKISSVNFRAKQTEGFGWKEYGFVIKDKQGRKLVSQSAINNLYLLGFSKNLFLRPSCHVCPAKSCKSHSDLTIGDFWGIWNKHSELDDNKGVSMVLINSECGKRMFDSLCLNATVYSYQDVVFENQMLCKSTPEPPLRVEFWKRFNIEGIICVIAIAKSMRPTLRMRVVGKLKRLFKI